MSDVDDGPTKRRRSDESRDDDEDVPKRRRGEGPRIELRILMQSKNAGAIIGKGGANINRLRNYYKASVTVPDSNGPERVLAIGAELGTVLNMLLDDILPGLEDVRSKSGDSESELRMIVHQSQAGCIIGRQGFKVKELREKTGANIKVFSTCCPNSTDRVVAISGSPRVVVRCIEDIVELLQQAPPKGPMNPYDPVYSDEFLAPDYGGFITGDLRASRGLPRGAAPPPRGLRGPLQGRMGLESFGMIMDFGRSSLRGGVRGDLEPALSRGLAFGGGGSLRGNLNANNVALSRGLGRFGGLQQDFGGDLGGGKGAAFGDDECETTQVTIPKDLAGAIIGKGGSRITDIRRRSGAMIIIDEPLPGSNDRIITISGTPDQIQNAQYLLQMSVKMNSNKY